MRRIPLSLIVLLGPWAALCAAPDAAPLHADISAARELFASRRDSSVFLSPVCVRPGKDS